MQTRTQTKVRATDGALGEGRADALLENDGGEVTVERDATFGYLDLYRPPDETASVDGVTLRAILTADQAREIADSLTAIADELENHARM